MSIQEKHDEVAREIRQGVPRRAQATLHGVLVSYHPGHLGGMAFTHVPLSSQQSDATNLAGGMIDAWVEGRARVTRGTFSRRELDYRAEKHRFGTIPGRQGDRQPGFADRIKAFADEHEGELAGAELVTT